MASPTVPSVVDAASQAAAQGMAKSGGEYYAFLVVALLLGALCLVLWFQNRQHIQRAQEAGLVRDPEDPKKWAVQDRRKAVPRCEACSELGSLEVKLSHQLAQMSDNLMDRMDTMEKNHDRTEKRQEDRLAAMERKLDDGFRAVHDRIDKHLEAHRPVTGRG